MKPDRTSNARRTGKRVEFSRRDVLGGIGNLEHVLVACSRPQAKVLVAFTDQRFHRHIEAVVLPCYGDCLLVAEAGRHFDEHCQGVTILHWYA